MNPALWVSKTGVQAQDAKLQAIANNLANVNTVGYKRDRVVFEDLFYTVEQQPGAQMAANRNADGGVQLGNGTRVAGTQDDRSEFFAGVHVPVGAETFWAGAGTGSTRHVSGSRATQASVAWLHSLDKSTTIYAVATTLHNGSASALTIDTATGSGPSVSPGRNASGLQAGLRYKF